MSITANIMPAQPGVPNCVERHAVRRQRARALRSWFGAMTFAMLFAGCATTDQHPLWKEPLVFRGRLTSPEVRVYGNLAHLLPQFDETPTLDLFLYGPNDEGKALLRNPQGMAQLGDRLLVCDQGRPDVIALSLTRGESKTWTDRRHTPRCPVDVCTDGQSVYIADSTNRSVLVYTANGKFEHELYPAGGELAAAPRRTTPSESGQAEPLPPVRSFRPTAVRLHAGVLYVANMGDRRIDRYEIASGHWLEPLSASRGYPRIAGPTGLDISTDGTLHIVDSLQQRVLRVRSDGRWLAPIGSPGRGTGQFVRPKSVCCTEGGLVLVTDAARQSVLVFDSTGAFVSEIHEQGGWKGFTLPASIFKLRASDGVSASVVRHQWPGAAEWIVVSDAMGGMPLVLIGTGEPREQATRAH